MSSKLTSVVSCLVLPAAVALLVVACSSTEESSSPVIDASTLDSSASDGAASDGTSPESQSPDSEATDGQTPDSGVADGESADSSGQDATPDAVADATADVGEAGEEAAPDVALDSQVPDLITLTFSIDDSANKTYEAVDGLAWKGSFAYSAANNLLTFDPAWGGPYAPLWDDGPVSAGGHEAEGAVASDHVWSTQVSIARPTTPLSIEYGAIRGSVSGSDGQWIWIGPNGMVHLEPTMAAGTVVDAPGLVIPAWGDVNVHIELDTKNLHPSFQSIDFTSVKLKTNVLGWSEIELKDDGLQGDKVAGDGIYLFDLQSNVGKHDGLLYVDDTVEFVFVLDSVEYKAGVTACSEGVTAESDSAAPGAFVSEVVTIAPNYNTSFVVGPN